MVFTLDTAGIIAGVLAVLATAAPEGTYEFSRTLADNAGAGHPQAAAMDGAGNLSSPMRG
jgi:hypothetical protein